MMEVWQWYDGKLFRQGLHRLRTWFTTYGERVNYCRHFTKDDKNRRRRFKTAVLDEILLGNIWNHTDSLKAAVREVRVAYNEKNYALAGKNFAKVLTELAGGLILHEDGRQPTPKEVNQSFHAREIAMGFMEGLVQKYDSKMVECFNDLTSFIPIFQEAFELITSKTTVGMIKGMTMLVKNVEKLAQNLEDCKANSNDVESIRTWAKTYQNSKDLE